MAKFCKISLPYFIFICVCSVGCIYHIFEVTKVFLDFHTKIDVSFDFTSEIVVPMVSFCGFTSQLLRNENHLNSSFTPSKIYNETYNVSEVFLNCSNHPDNIHNGNGIEIERVINYERVCFTFKYSKKSWSRGELKAKEGLLYSFSLRIPLNGYRLYITSDYNVPNGDSLNHQHILGKINLILNILSKF